MDIQLYSPVLPSRYGGVAARPFGSVQIEREARIVGERQRRDPQTGLDAARGVGAAAGETVGDIAVAEVDAGVYTRLMNGVEGAWRAEFPVYRGGADGGAAEGRQLEFPFTREAGERGQRGADPLWARYVGWMASGGAGRLLSVYA